MQVLCLPKILHVRDQTYGAIQAFVDHEYVLQYCLEGDVDFRVETYLIPMTAGTAILMPPNTPHGIHDIRSGNQRYIVVHYLLPFDPLPLTGGLTYASFQGARQERVTRNLLDMAAEWNSRDTNCELLAQGLLLEVLGLVGRESAKPSASPMHQPPSWRNVEAVIQWIHHNYGQGGTIEEMSEVATLSPAHFCKVFKAYTGVSPHRYLQRVRIERARELLFDARLTCSMIADRTGFPNVAAFSRSFRDVVGTAPTHWIKQQRPSKLAA